MESEVLDFSRAQSDLSIFESWFTQHGGHLHSNIKLKTFDGSDMGNGMLSIKDIEEKEEIISIPLDIILSIETMKVSDDPFHVIIAEKVEAAGLDSDIPVAIALILEKNKSDKSFFYPYVKILPEYTPSLVYFTDSELAELQHADVIDGAKSYKITLKKRYNDLLSIAKKIKGFAKYSLPLNFNDTSAHLSVDQAVHRNSLDKLDSISWDEFLWATCIIDSRALRFKGRVYLAPMADILNYAPIVGQRPQNSGELFLKYHSLNDHGITVLSDRKHRAGEQMFEDYGDNADLIYVTHHGFVPDVNPFRCAKVVGPNMISLPEDTLQLLKSLKFRAPPSFCVGSVIYDLGQAISVYFTALSFDSEEIASCLLKTNVSTPVWREVFESCKFFQVAKFLRDVAIRNNDDIFYFPSKDSFPRLNITPMLSDDEYNSILSDSSSLEMTTLRSVRKWLELIHPQYTTSLSDDISKYEWLKSQESTSYDVRRVHQLLALKYRIHQKLIWANFCTVYEASCNIWTLAEKNLEETEAVVNVEVIGPDLIHDDVDREALTLKQKLDRFNSWFNAVAESTRPSPAINALKAVEDENYRIGTIATRDITAEEVYLQVPLKVILNSEKAKLSPVGELLEVLTQKFGKPDEYHELIFLLMHQRFMEGSESFFWPYIGLLPQPHELIDLPLFWSPEEVSQRLRPSYVMKGVLQYREHVANVYSALSKMTEINDFFPSNVFTFENYRWATAILDSRTIWWNGQRNLVPMLDFVNCKELDYDRSRVHKTVLDRTNTFAETHAGAPFKHGEQVFENYGQPNYIYFQFHGFALISSENVNENSHDCVLIELVVTAEEGEKLDKQSPIVQKLVEDLKLRDKAVMTECLKYPIPENVWKMLALKMNTVNKLSSRKKLGKPTNSATKYLMDWITDRLKAYEEYDGRHYESRRFIMSEKSLLEKLRRKLKNDLDDSDAMDIKGGHIEL